MIDETKQMCIYNTVHICKKMYNTVLFFIELLYTFVIYNVKFYWYTHVKY